uniref:THAP-type domain-containing protein n=1 Tax=Oryzias latipes TaxID=8090 RepID=A0A3P9ILE3_ORYLA
MSGFRVKERRLVFQRVTKTSQHCCVPLCANSSKYNSSISFHSFPKDMSVRAEWIVRVRREDFTPSKTSRVCSRHFQKGDFVNNPWKLKKFHSYDHLMALWRLIEPATSRMIRVTSVAREASASVAEKTTANRSTKLLPIDELFLFLNYLSTGCTQRELGHRFNIHRTTASRIITTWANFLYCVLGAICIWMTPEAITANLPPEFKDYADTQVIVDCTELRCQTPSSLVLQSEVYSHYKSHCTFKAMIGMAPHGPLTFVSALYGGSISDRELFKLSGIIPLLSPDMAVMVDKGFRVENLVPGKLHRPGFRSNNNQMAAQDVLETQSIARLRVHVERLIRRVKENKLFDTVIPLSISGSINQLFTVACILSNYQNGPLVKDWREH